MRTFPATDLLPATIAEVLYGTAVNHWGGTGEWPAALYVLAFPYLMRDDRIWRHVEISATDPWLDAPQSERRIGADGQWEVGEAFVSMLHLADMRDEGKWSTGELFLVETALSLFNGSAKVNLHRLQYLTEGWEDRVLEALAIFTGRQRWSAGTLEQLRQQFTPAVSS